MSFLDPNLNLDVFNLKIDIGKSDGIYREVISMEAKLAANAILLIGDTYLFTSTLPYYFNRIIGSKYTRKVDCDLRLLQNDSEEDICGKMLFHEDQLDGALAGEHLNNAKLEIELYLDKDFFHRVYENIKNKIAIKALSIGVKNLEFAEEWQIGVKKWTLNKSEKYLNKYPSLDIVDVDFLFDPLI